MHAFWRSSESSGAYRDLLSRAAVAGALLLGVGWSSPAAMAQTKAPALVFSPTAIEANQQANLCASNWTETTVTVEFVLQGAARGSTLESEIATVAPESATCTSFSNLGGAAAPVPILVNALIGLVAPGPCRVLVQPGPCRVLGSLEISDTATGGNRIHAEPTLLPAVQLPGATQGQ